MNILQPLESSYLGVGDNYLVLEGVSAFADVVYTVHGVTDETYTFCYTANDGIIKLNIREITRLVYDNLANYEDPFDYTADQLYTETDEYHFIKIDIDITDGASDNLQVLDLKIVNAALDVGECLLIASLIDEILDEEAGKEGVLLDALAFDLNHSLH